jgi:Lipase
VPDHPHNYKKLLISRHTVVDWSEIAKDNNYFVAARETEAVGRYVAIVIDKLVGMAMIRLNELHIIGHSLGAHAAGATGANLQSGRVARISGLDPALPGFGKRRPNNKKLDFGDATFVDVIHTCGGLLAEESCVGHVDFYPNNGRRSQPGCDYYNDIVCYCSHSKAYEYFATSITNDRYVAQQCTNWDDYKSARCKDNPTM